MGLAITGCTNIFGGIKDPHILSGIMRFNYLYLSAWQSVNHPFLSSFFQKKNPIKKNDYYPVTDLTMDH